jgi:uncharacterized protein (TIGR03083 family)
MPSDPAAARRTIATLRASHERLRALVEPLPAERLGQPSYCDDWTIAQVLSHLGSQAEILDATFVALRDGAEAPGRDTMPPVWDRWNAMSPDEQRDANLAVNEAAVEHLEALSDDQLADLELSLFDGFMQVDVEGFAGLRIGEHTMHSWDVAVALDPTARLAPDATALMIDGIGSRAAMFGKPQGTKIRLRVDVTDPARSFALLVDDEVRLEPWADQEVAGTLRLPAETFLRLAFGRLRGSDDVQLDADDVTLDDVRAAFPGF